MKKKIAIFGLGRVGIALAQYFLRQPEKTVAIDDCHDLSDLSAEAQNLDIQKYLGGAAPLAEELSACYVSPGISLKHPIILSFRRREIPIYGELDLAASLTQKPILAITGTNGKSTTTVLCAKMLEASGVSVGVGGNLGIPFIDLVQKDSDYDVYVIEVSSYQLELAKKFHPKVSVILNLSDDHLERHKNLDNYRQVKMRIFKNQRDEDYLVYNLDDLQVLKMVERASVPLASFSSMQHRANCYEDSDELILDYKQFHENYDLSQRQLAGLHNLENIMAAVLASRLMAAQPQAIQETLNTFKGLPHRLQKVGTIKDIDFYNDSKATNVASTVMSLASFEENVVLILGGRDKGGDYSPLKPLIKNKCAALVLLGENRDELFKLFSHLDLPILRVNSMKEAVLEAYSLLDDQGTVLLAPACSSFDLYKNFEERGNHFTDLVQGLASESDR